MSVQSSRQHMYTGTLGHGGGRYRHLHTGYYGTYLEYEGKFYDERNECELEFRRMGQNGIIF